MFISLMIWDSLAILINFRVEVNFKDADMEESTWSYNRISNGTVDTKSTKNLVYKYSIAIFFQSKHSSSVAKIEVRKTIIISQKNKKSVIHAIMKYYVVWNIGS